MGKHGAGASDGWRSGFAGRIEVRESATGRREWPEAVKGRIVRESLEPGTSVKECRAPTRDRAAAADDVAASGAAGPAGTAGGPGRGGRLRLRGAGGRGGADTNAQDGQRRAGVGR